MEKVQIKGIESFNANEKEEVQEIINKAYEKIKRMINNDFYIRINIKQHAKIPEDQKDKTKQIKYSIQAEISGEIPKIEASAFDWDLRKSLHMVFGKLEQELEHKFHLSSKF